MVGLERECEENKMKNKSQVVLVYLNYEQPLKAKKKNGKICLKTNSK